MLIRIFSRAHQKCLLIVSFFPREGAETGGSGWLKGLEMNFFEKSFEAQNVDFDQWNQGFRGGCLWLVARMGKIPY